MPKPETDVSRLAWSRRAGDVSALIAQGPELLYSTFNSRQSAILFEDDLTHLTRTFVTRLNTFLEIFQIEKNTGNPNGIIALDL